MGVASLTLLLGLLVPVDPGFVSAHDVNLSGVAQSAGQPSSGQGSNKPSGSGDGRGGRQGSSPPPQSFSGWVWWRDSDVRKELQLTDEQVRRIEGIFEKREAEIKPVMDRIHRESDRLNKMIYDRVADEASFSVQVAQLEALWTRVRESRTIMLYRMYRELQPDQHKKFQEMMAARNRTRNSGPGR
jgi:Spy/CpxP family protein refolding chaperone